MNKRQKKKKLKVVFVSNPKFDKHMLNLYGLAAQGFRTSASIFLDARKQIEKHYKALIQIANDSFIYSDTDAVYVRKDDE